MSYNNGLGNPCASNQLPLANLYHSLRLASVELLASYLSSLACSSDPTCKLHPPTRTLSVVRATEQAGRLRGQALALFMAKNKLVRNKRLGLGRAQLARCIIADELPV